MSRNSKAAGRRAGRIQLFPSVGLALFAGLCVAFVAYRFLRRITPVDASKTAAEIDVTRVALTVVAGVGGVVALVIAYRRQRDLEQSRFVERFGAAAAQLGATDVAVRIAGVYAMAGVADESEGLRRQQCIDVLCGYLRLPYSPELGANHQSKLIVKQHRATADGTRADDQERHLEFRHNDKEVRATIIRVIADHLRPSAEYSWSTSDFDLRTAHLEDVDLSKVTFSGSARFDGAIFAGTTQFDGATFSSIAQFDGATFSSIAQFDEATFSRTARFEGATFSGTAWFNGATFSRTAGFGGATFSGTAGFNGATFSDLAQFEAATFSSTAGFDRATFSGFALFGRAIFSGTAGFNLATFSSNAALGRATFS
ncbi:pentapeptide repeat-containing protein, partial [Nocardia fluminea]|uniref:pentapeptide repeat-containing protein n=1 Tax=Nocardia fluminea TaxID=134984 RepID=UPI003D10F51F